MNCVACGKNHNRKDVVYTEDKLPYCANPFTCNDEHPNSVKNIVARGGAVTMFTESELDENIFDTLSVSPEMKERVLKIASKPQSIRLSKYDIAYYLILLQETKELASISEAVRYCVTNTMQHEPIKAPDYVAPSPVPDMPKSINVDWDAVKEPEPEPVPVEDEFTF